MFVIQKSINLLKMRKKMCEIPQNPCHYTEKCKNAPQTSSYRNYTD